MNRLMTPMAAMTLCVSATLPVFSAPSVQRLESRATVAEPSDTQSLSCWVKVSYERQDGSTVVLEQREASASEVASMLNGRAGAELNPHADERMSIEIGCSL